MFIPYSYDGGVSDSWEYLPISDMPAQVGKAMVMSGGVLTQATGAEMPTYICMTNKEDTEEGDIVAVIRVNERTRFATTLSADGSAIEVGDKLQISTDGLEVTANTGGCFEITEIRGTNKGDEVIGRFVEGGAA